MVALALRHGARGQVARERAIRRRAQVKVHRRARDVARQVHAQRRAVDRDAPVEQRARRALVARAARRVRLAPRGPVEVVRELAAELGHVGQALGGRTTVRRVPARVAQLERERVARDDELVERPVRGVRRVLHEPRRRGLLEREVARAREVAVLVDAAAGRRAVARRHAAVKVERLEVPRYRDVRLERAVVERDVVGRSRWVLGRALHRRRRRLGHGAAHTAVALRVLVAAKDDVLRRERRAHVVVVLLRVERVRRREAAPRDGERRAAEDRAARRRDVVDVEAVRERRVALGAPLAVHPDLHVPRDLGRVVDDEHLDVRVVLVRDHGRVVADVHRHVLRLRVEAKLVHVPATAGETRACTTFIRVACFVSLFVVLRLPPVDGTPH